MKKISILIFILITFFIYGKAVIAQKITVSGSINKKSVSRGKSANGTIILIVPNDLHINSNKPLDEFLIPTSVKFSSSNIKIGKIIYPKGLLKKFAFSENPLSVYEGKTVIKFNFDIPAKFINNEVKIQVVIQYQACNQEVCFSPKKEKIILLAKIR